HADARALPVGNASMDVVTSFETIEHFDRQEDFVAEVRRVLRPDGCFIVSTPDRDIYTPPGTTPNPFHVHEFDRVEFLDLLHRYFRYVSLIRQRPMLSSALIPEEPASVAPLIFERVEDRTFASDIALPGAPYLIAIASEMVPKLAPVSLLIERGEADDFRSADQEAELVRLRISETKAREDAETERQAAEAERETARTAVEAARKSVEQAEADAKAATVTLTHTRAALVEANTELELLSHSFWHFLRQYVARIWHRFVR
ncbi:MAG TPA: methyltransferase domain-containing protein, partial [Acetobacteraceae bacterium]|nr:methyltransferase domain-containing protein [Acetobacteraceae bacterium]